MYDFNFRLYDPVIGRFIQQEPLGLDGPNPYHFTFNNPVNSYDPNGLYNVWNPFTWGDPNSVDDTILTSLSPLARGSALEINFQILYGVARTAIGLAAFLGGDEQTAIWGSPITQMEELNPNWRNTSSGDMFNCGIYALAGGTIGAYSTLGFENLFLGGANIELLWRGDEFVFVDPSRTTEIVRLRISPLGHGIGPWYRIIPHYHRRGPGGIGLHRPWETILKWFE
jgi:hypothetical protein